MACQICNHGVAAVEGCGQGCRRPYAAEKDQTLGTTSLPAGRDAVLSVPLFFFATCERRASVLIHSLVPVRRVRINRPNASPPKRSGTLGATSLPAGPLGGMLSSASHYFSSRRANEGQA